MKKIILSDKTISLVDNDDFEWLNQWEYHNLNDRATRLVVTNGKLKRILMHREIVHAPNGKVVDHINGNSLDNRKSNLRICSHAENNRNISISKNNTSGYKGVHWHKIKKKWQAKIKLNRKDYHLGYFDNILDASDAYDVASVKLHGEFGKTNREIMG